MKKGIMTIALIAVLALTATPVFADDRPSTYRVDTSVNMTAWAWECLLDENYAGALGWAKRCAYFWGPRAAAQFTDPGPLNQANLDAAIKELDTADFEIGISTIITHPKFLGEILVNRWALNDVAICYFIVGEATRIQATSEADKTAADVYYDDGAAWTMAVGVSIKETGGVVTHLVNPIWRIDQACGDRKALAWDAALYPTPLK